MDKFIDYINSKILPNIEYGKLQESYATDDKQYAKSVLHDLHEAVKLCYGTSEFDGDSYDSNDGFVLLPGVVLGIKTGKIAIALLEFDLSSAGEHRQTTFLLDIGLVPQATDNKKLNARIIRDFMPYEYGYTTVIHRDIHVNPDTLPEAIQDMLSAV